MRGGAVWLMLATAGVAAQTLPAPATPAGLWKTIDDKTGKPRAQVRIGEAGGVFSGRIERGYNPAEDDRICSLCTDDRKDRPLRGLLVVRNMKADGEVWSGGDILDPDNGMIYRCRMTLTDQGRRLEVRGYLGIMLLGRSQVWERLE